MITLTCPVCNNKFERFPSQIKISYERGSKKLFCSVTCMSKDPDRVKRAERLGKSNTWAKGRRYNNRKGYFINPRGYKLLYKPDYPGVDSSGYIMEHRFVWENFWGRHLKPTEKIHHKDRNRLNNDIKNLKLCRNQAMHIFKHRDKTTGRFI